MTGVNALALAATRDTGMKWGTAVFTDEQFADACGNSSNWFGVGQVFATSTPFFRRLNDGTDLLASWSTTRNAIGGSYPRTIDRLAASNSTLFTISGASTSGGTVVSNIQALASADQGATWTYTYGALGSWGGPLSWVSTGQGRVVISGMDAFTGTHKNPFLVSIADSTTSISVVDHTTAFRAALIAGGNLVDSSSVLSTCYAAGKTLIFIKGSAGTQLYTTTDISVASPTFTLQSGFTSMLPAVADSLYVVSSGQRVMAFITNYAAVKIWTSISDDGGVTWATPSNTIQAAGGFSAGGLSWTGKAFFTQGSYLSPDGQTWTRSNTSTGFTYSGLVTFWRNQGLSNGFDGTTYETQTTLPV